MSVSIMAAGYALCTVRRRGETKWMYPTNNTKKELCCVPFLTSVRVRMSTYFSGTFHSVAWWLATDVSGQPIPVTLNGQAVQKKCSTLEDGTYIQSKRRQVRTAKQCCVILQKIEDLCYNL